MLPKKLRHSGQFLLEIFLQLPYIIFATLPFFIPDEKLSPNKNRQSDQTIVIIKRWFSWHILHYYWKKYLQDKGFTVYLINYPLHKMTFRESAEKLREFIEENRLKNVTLVGISGGALTCYLYLQELDGWKRVKHFFSLGGPLKGTWAFLPLFFLGSGRELLPQSQLIKSLNNKEVKNPERITSIQARKDEYITPKSSRLKGAKNITLDIIGHNNLHMSSRLPYELIAKEA